MKNITYLLLLLIMLCFAGTSDAGTSFYDEMWDITVTNCSGKTVVYTNCTIVEMNEQHVVFIPAEGRIPTKTGKRKIVPINSDCVTVFMDEK